MVVVLANLKNNCSCENILQLYGMCTLGFMFLKSSVSCQELAEALQQNSTLTNLNLAYSNIGDEGEGRVKAPPYESDIREMSERRCSAVLILVHQVKC